MAKLPAALETRDGDGRLPIEIAIGNALDGGSSDALSGLMKLPGMTTNLLLLEIVVKNNGYTALKVLFEKMKTSWRTGESGSCRST